MILPWVPALPLPDAEFERFRRRAIFDCFKWDPQVEDSCALSRVPVVLRSDAWAEVAALAEVLAEETLAAEAELAQRPELHGRLGLPRAVRRALERVRTQGPAAGVARLIRFDFHHASDGWRISEANTDVPGGMNEAAGLPALLAPFHPSATPVGNPASAYVDALLRDAPDGHVVLAHATAYSDDHQVMAYLARQLEAAGARPVLASPSHFRWHDGAAMLESTWYDGPVDAVARFFPAEWLPQLPTSCGWDRFFAGARTPVSNPATAILTQSKRFPLAWDALTVALPTWRKLLPETCDPRDAPWRDRIGQSDEWVLKPALGRVGEDVGIAGLLSPKEWKGIESSVRASPERWVAQRRFDASPLDVGGQVAYPCIGVFTIGGKAAGAQGRLARRPLIDARAGEAAVLVESDGSKP